MGPIRFTKKQVSALLDTIAQLRADDELELHVNDDMENLEFLERMMQAHRRTGVTFGIVPAEYGAILRMLIQASPIVGVSSVTFNAMAVNAMRAGLGAIFSGRESLLDL